MSKMWRVYEIGLDKAYNKTLFNSTATKLQEYFKIHNNINGPVVAHMFKCY